MARKPLLEGSVATNVPIKVRFARVSLQVAATTLRGFLYHYLVRNATLVTVQKSHFCYILNTKLYLHFFSLLLPMFICFPNWIDYVGKLDYIGPTYPVPW